MTTHNRRTVYPWFQILIGFYLYTQIGCLINDGVTLHLDIVCGENTSEIANVTFLTDVDYVQAVAFCSNRTEKELIKIDEFRSYIEVSYPGGPEDVGCQFMRTHGLGVEVFNINIEVASLVNGTLILNYEDVFSMTCSFGDEMDEVTEKTIDDSRFPASSLPQIMGDNMTTTLLLDVIDYHKKSLTGQRIPIGKPVRLKGVLDVTVNETAPRAFSCKALSYDEKSSYDLLIGGCGDGRIFPKDYGFVTDGNIAYSPFFKAFRMEGDVFIKFQCQFTVCTKPGGCDGNSCFKSTKKMII